MECDMKRCQIWFKGKCTSEEERDKCPLMEARASLRAADETIRKMKEKFKIEILKE